MSDTDPKPILEALLFAADGPVAAKKLGEIAKVDTLEVRRILKELKENYDEQGRGFELIEVAGGWQVLSREDYGEFIKQLHKTYVQAKLSQAALETLAIVAYRQPILRAEIDAIRGVNTGPLLRTLTDRGLVKIVGRADTLGRPTLYGTTRKFLERFALKSLKELPQADDAENQKRESADAPDVDEETVEQVAVNIAVADPHPGPLPEGEGVERTEDEGESQDDATQEVVAEETSDDSVEQDEAAEEDHSVDTAAEDDDDGPEERKIEEVVVSSEN